MGIRVATADEVSYLGLNVGDLVIDCTDGGGGIVRAPRTLPASPPYTMADAKTDLQAAVDLGATRATDWQGHTQNVSAFMRSILVSVMSRLGAGYGRLDQSPFSSIAAAYAESTDAGDAALSDWLS